MLAFFLSLGYDRSGDDMKQTWRQLLAAETEKTYFKELLLRVEKARKETEIYPVAGKEFAALELTPAEGVRVVILGQDPYHEPDQAMGLSFSVPEGVKLPPSLRNIYQELHSDLDVEAGKSGDLTHWARQGVLLLNTVLTVEKGKANSHAQWGWQHFTDRVIEATNELTQPIAFVLWGAQAQKKASLIHTAAPRLILNAPHPSPLSSYRGFFGSKPFSKINAFLREQGEKEIQWQQKTPSR